MLDYDWRIRPLAANRRPWRELIMTPTLKYALSVLHDVDGREPGSLTFVVGPGGSAKTSLCEALPIQLFGDPTRWPEGCIPMISVSARIPDRAYFSWGALSSSLLQEVLDPFRSPQLDKTRVDPCLYEDLVRARNRSMKLRFSAVEMWDAFIPIAKQVGLRHIAIDEGSLLTINQQNRLPSDYIEALRAAAIVIGCTVILFGTYELLQVIDFSAQNNRRNFNIQLERLLCETTDEMKLFLSVAEDIGRQCSVAPALVRANPEWLYDATYGIVGELVELFRRARSHAKASGAKNVSKAHLNRACHLPPALARMRYEADEIDRAFERVYAKPRPSNPPATRATRTRGRRKAKRLSLGLAE